MPLTMMRTSFSRVLAATFVGFIPMSALASVNHAPRDVTSYAQAAVAILLASIIWAIFWIPGKFFPTQRKRCARLLILLYLPSLVVSWILTMCLSFGLLKLIDLAGYAEITSYSGSAGLAALLFVWVAIALLTDASICALVFRLRPNPSTPSSSDPKQ
jgi:membrane protease YdiL (CAAX protease family)